jgi:hypothetical protein
MTAIAENPVTDVSLAVATADAELLIRAIQNVALFASKDVTLPALCAVHLTAARGTLRVEATDRYALAQERMPCTGRLDVLVDLKAAVAAAKTLTAALKPSRRMFLAVPPSIAITAEHGYVRFTLTGHVGPAMPVAAETVCGEYLARSDDKFGDLAELAKTCTGEITFNSEYLARIAKVNGGDKYTYARFTVGTSHKPSIVHIGDAFRALVMPVRQAA